MSMSFIEEMKMTKRKKIVLLLIDEEKKEEVKVINMGETRDLLRIRTSDWLVKSRSRK